MTNIPDINVCLVTYRSVQFLEKFYFSLQPHLLKHPNLKLRILLNGSPKESVEFAFGLKLKHTNQVAIIINEINDPRYAVNMERLVANVNGWAIFPGDDDEVLENFPELCINEISKNEDSCVLAFQSIATDISNNTQTIETPSHYDQNNSILEIVSAFKAPPFVWPSTLFNLKYFKCDGTYSRYANDWVISLNAIRNGKCVVVKKPLVRYHLHPNQESNLASLEHKLYDSTNAIHLWLDQSGLLNELRNIEISLKEKIWEKLLDSKMFYGNYSFALPIIKKLLDNLINLEDDVLFTAKLILQYYIIQGEYLKPIDIIHLVSFNLQNPGIAKLRGTILSPVKDSCLFDKPFFNRENKISILACRHSKNSFAMVSFDCATFNESDYLTIDAFHDYLQTSINRSGPSAISDGERLIIEFVRKNKKHLPSFLINFGKKLKM